MTTRDLTGRRPGRPPTIRTKAALRVAAVLLVLAAGCSGGDDAPPPNADVSGQWSGTWQSDQGAGGNLRIVFSGRQEQRFFGADVFDVDLFMTGASCFSEDHAFGQDSATTIQNSLNFSVIFADGVFGFDLLFVHGTFDFGGTVEGSRIQGAYTQRDLLCDFCRCPIGSSGTWAVSR